MRDPSDIFTKRGTPVVLVGSRVAFVGLALIVLYVMNSSYFPLSVLDSGWFAYLVLLYGAAEVVYRILGRNGIDLTFAFPLLFAVYLLNVVSSLIGGQDQLPLLNRAEHFTSFILIGYVVWVFFLQYLPQKVWRNHPYYTALLVLSVTAALGVGNEIIELALDSLFGSQHIGDQYDTPLDLLMNTLGSGLFLAVRLILGPHIDPVKPTERTVQSSS